MVCKPCLRSSVDAGSAAAADVCDVELYSEQLLLVETTHEGQVEKISLSEGIK